MEVSVNRRYLVLLRTSYRLMNYFPKGALYRLGEFLKLPKNKRTRAHIEHNLFDLFATGQILRLGRARAFAHREAKKIVQAHKAQTNLRPELKT